MDAFGMNGSERRTSSASLFQQCLQGLEEKIGSEERQRAMEEMKESEHGLAITEFSVRDSCAKFETRCLK